MTATTYTVHSANNHAVEWSGQADDLIHAAALVAGSNMTGTKRFYVHNGKGVVAAFLTRNGSAHEVLRQDYMQFDSKARAAREADGHPNDPR